MKCAYVLDILFERIKKKERRKEIGIKEKGEENEKNG